MFTAAKILALYAETPLHPGTGSTLGAIDLPIQRERHTHFPVLPSSSLKGVMRDEADPMKLMAAEVAEIFGPTVGAGNDHAGALSPTDGRILLFPVRALKGIFVWVTCPFVVERLRRDLGFTTSEIGLPTGLDVIEDGEAWVENAEVVGTQLVLEDDDYSVSVKPEMLTLREAIVKLFPDGNEHEALRSRLPKQLALISDTDFARLVTTGTEVVTRVRLNEQKTTTGGVGNMWVQEYIPSDALFYSLLLAMPSRRANPSLASGDAVLSKLRELLTGNYFQIGGDESVGRGWMRLRWV